MTAIPAPTLGALGRWAGHAEHAPDTRLSNRLLYGVRAKPRHKDSIETSLNDLGIQTANWKSPALDHLDWCSIFI